MYTIEPHTAGRGSAVQEPGPDVPERHVVHAWMELAAAGRTFTTLNGCTVSVVRPGSVNPYDGPDIALSVITIDGVRKEGPVEVHRRIEDWYLHGHHLDPAYAGVILHIVNHAPDGPPPPGLPPTVALARCVAPGERRPALLDAPSSGPVPACRPLGYGWDGGKAESMIALAASWRYRRKFSQMEERHSALAGTIGSRQAWIQTLYEFLARACGYGGNEDAMQRLAAAMPVSPPETGAAMLNDMRAMSALESAEGTGAGWRSKSVRPANRPRRRMTALAEFLPYLAAPDVLERTRSCILAAAGDARSRPLGMWVPHAAAALGPERAFETGVNVLAPWGAAIAQTTGDGPLLKAAGRLYFHSSPAPQNRYTRAWSGWFGAPVPFTSGVQQGIIQLMKSDCTGSGCMTCLVPGLPH